MSCSCGFFGNVKRILFPPQSHGVKRSNKITDKPIADTSTSQPLTVSTGIPAQPHSSCSAIPTSQTQGPLKDPTRVHSLHRETSAVQIHGSLLHDLSPLTAEGSVTAVPSDDYGSPSSSTVVPSGGSSSSPSSDVQSLPFTAVSTRTIRVPEPTISENPALHIITSPSQVQATGVHTAILPRTESTPGPNVVELPSHSSVVWAETLDIAKKKLSNHNLPPLGLADLTSQSAEENIKAVITALNTLQNDDKKKRWKYTRHGREVIFVERVGKVLKIVEKYSKVVDTAIQAHRQVCTLVWAGVLNIMQVGIYCTHLGHLMSIHRTVFMID